MAVAREFSSSSRLFLGSLVLILIVVGYAWWRVGQCSPQAVPVSDSVTVPSMEKPATATLVAVGDVWLSRKVGKLIASYGEEYPIVNIKLALREADLAFANLETPISNRGQALPGKGICFRADPATMTTLTEAGFDILNLANNHSVDYDSPALLDTIELLNQVGIKTVGAGANITEARRPQILEVNGLKVGFLAYSEMADLFFSYQYPRRFQATETVPGVAPLILKEIQVDVQQLRPQVDVLIVSLHWGVEYTELPTPEQRKLAHALIDSGVDAIIGHHPHVFQAVEVYQGKPIAYSLGNFITDQNFSFPTREALLLKLQLDRQGVAGVTILPVFIPESQPVVLKDTHGQQILEKLQNLSRKLDTELLITGEQGYLPGLRGQVLDTRTRKGGTANGRT